MNRLLIVAGAAVLLVAVVGGGAFIGGRASVAVTAYTVPGRRSESIDAPSAAATTPVPAELQSMWVAAPRTVPGLAASYRYRFELTDGLVPLPAGQPAGRTAARGRPRSSTATSSG